MPIQIRFISFNFLTDSRNSTGQFVAPVNITLMLMLILSVAISFNVNADERVYTYSSTIKVLKNRTLDVTETITVNVENVKILHGIHWDFETTHVNQDNKKVKVDLKILSLKRNGETEPYHSTKQENIIRVFFGSKTKLVSKGIQTYTLRYLASNKLNSYKNKDEFYWNASGNKWSMPIFRVEATVILPTRVKQKTINFQAYSGYTGVNKQDYISTFTNNHTIKFALNRKYLVGDGLTIAIDWPTGYIDAAPVVEPPTITVADTRSIQLDMDPEKVKSPAPEKIVEQAKQDKTSDGSTTNDTIVIEKPLLETVKNAVAQLQEAKLEPRPDAILAETSSANSSMTKSTDDTSSSDTALDLTAETPTVTSTTIQPIAAVINNEANKSDASKSVIVVINDLVNTKIPNYVQNTLTVNNKFALLGFILLLSYFLLARRYLIKKKLDNNNTQETEIQFNDLSPAAIRYINEMGYDDRTFAIALINIAVKGHIDIIKKDNHYDIERRDYSSAEQLSDDETLLLNTLMGDSLIIKLSSINHEIIHDAMTQHQNQLEKELRSKYFSTKGYWFNFGFVFLASTILAVAYIEQQPIQTLLVFSLVGLFSLISFLLCYMLLELNSFYKNFRISAIADSALFKSMQDSKEAYIFAIIAIDIGLIFLSIMFIDIVNIMTITIASIICAIFSDHLNSNNSERDSILNKILTLKESITHAEALQDNTQYDSIQLSQKIIAFDNYLPYTIALGVESAWGDHYSLLFDHKDNEELIGYSPHWYHDSNWIDNNTTGFCESLSSKFSISAAAAALSPDTGFSDIDATSKTKH